MPHTATYRTLERCRICGNDALEPVLDLGEQALTGVFPKSEDDAVTAGPLRLLKCVETDGRAHDHCGLLQLAHSYEPDEMYGDNYGYRSGLNADMVAHLESKVEKIRKDVPLRPGAIVLDIGSNDATTLRAWPEQDLRLVGMDPTGAKFRSFYPQHVQLVADFFSAPRFETLFPGERAQVVTSFSMFYDLEDPMAFMGQVYEVLADDGAWVFEQSYMPFMLDRLAYDTVCHEHLEFYGLRQIKWMADRVGFVITDVEFNDVNGGSFSVTARKAQAGTQEAPMVVEILEQELERGLNELEPYLEFARRVAVSRDALRDHLRAIRKAGHRVYGLGASTKGNVLLQYCGLDHSELEAIGEVNAEKLGRFTPGTRIPIVAESELLAAGAEYLLVLPWHFRDFFLKAPHLKGRKLIFPLPELETIAT